jgi:N-acetylglutamate synthase-like GNAT family acetyltransferase
VLGRIHDDTGRLAAVAALAWSAPDVGLLTGVTVHPDARGQGLGREVCSFAIAGAVARHGTARFPWSTRTAARPCGCTGVSG